jgi:hypothetical protein
MNNNMYTSTPKAYERISAKNKGMLIIVLTFIFLAFVELSATAQSRPAANLNANGIIQLPTDKPLDTHYEFDLSQFNFKSDREMLEFLSTKSGSDYFVRANTESKKAILIIDKTQHPDWNAQQWNQHLQSKTAEKSFKK